MVCGVFVALLIKVVFMRSKAMSLFGLYRYCLHVALRKREIGSFNEMLRHCRGIQLRIFVTDKSQCRCSSEYYASSIYEDDILSRLHRTVCITLWSVQVKLQHCSPSQPF